MREEWTGVKVTRRTKGRLEALSRHLGLSQGDLVARLADWGEQIISGEAVRLAEEPTGAFRWQVSSSLPLQRATATLEWVRFGRSEEEVFPMEQNG